MITVKHLIARRDRPSDRGRPPAQGARSVVVFGCASAGDAAAFRGEVGDEGERDDGRSDQVYDERFVSHSRRARRSIVSRPTRKLMNTEAA
jgi:hypothetical protein